MKTRWITILAIVALVGSGIWSMQRRRTLSTPVYPVAKETTSAAAPAPADACVADGTINTKVGPYKSTLYFFCLPLNSSTVLFENPKTLSGFGEDEFEAGQFEVIVKPSAFPVTTPNACKGIIVRMPWTLYSQSTDAKAKVAAKKALYDEILALKSNPSGHVNVVVQLNPYVAVAQAAPLKLKLTQCNVFFRDVGGKYVPAFN